MSEQAAAPAAPAPIASEAPQAGESTQEAVDSQGEGQETLEAAEETLADPKASKTEKKAAEKQIKKYSLKVDNQMEDMELDLSNEEEVKKHLQLSKVAQKRMQETAEYKKNMQKFFDVLKSDPLSILSDPNLGIDVKAMAEVIMNNEIENLKKSPEQREKEQLQKELEELRGKQKKEEETRKEAERTRMTEQAAQQLDTDISSALETSGLPKSPRTVKYMAEAMLLALDNNIDLSAKDIVPLIKKQTLSEFRELIGAMPEDALEDFIGKDTINKMRKRAVAKVKAPIDTPQVKSTGQKGAPVVEEKKIAFKDFFKPY